MREFQGYLWDRKLNVYSKDRGLITPRIYRRKSLVVKGTLFTAGYLASMIFYDGETLFLKDSTKPIEDTNVVLCKTGWFCMLGIKGYIFNHQRLCVNVKKCILINPCVLYDPITKDVIEVYGFRNKQIKLEEIG